MALEAALGSMCEINVDSVGGRSKERDTDDGCGMGGAMEGEADDMSCRESPSGSDGDCRRPLWLAGGPGADEESVREASRDTVGERGLLTAVVAESARGSLELVLSAIDMSDRSQEWLSLLWPFSFPQVVSH